MNAFTLGQKYICPKSKSTKQQIFSLFHPCLQGTKHFPVINSQNTLLIFPQAEDKENEGLNRPLGKTPKPSNSFSLSKSANKQVQISGI